MKNSNPITVYNSKALTRKKARQLGVFETFRMVRHGRKDGRIGLPKSDEQGAWMSPLLHREADAYQEFHTAAWARTDIELADEHVEAETLYREIRRNENRLERLLQNAPEELTDRELSARRSGEEDLEESVVRARRKREYDRKNAAYYQKIQGLEDRLEQAYTRLLELKAHIMQVENATRLTTEKVRNHARLRMDAYWQGAYKTHGNAAELPPEPPLVCEASTGEDLYTAGHEVREAELARVRERLCALQSQHNHALRDDTTNDEEEEQ